ncbi:nucleotidyl transferase AbiEii/AbiGii toxin family protein [Proteiniclasticum sp. BAD-10]|uniref:Nucleotidyl transferase AbiEii/AbiGii toxin family protein n=1 Tax=Proteiniclasticum sediminis TaxID=2804028 RepID=A0A941CRJ1_9CLOT|nr:nucleotidyl transferase AbiEii/AbiGii toxin family protein [Proteiniclasticum sediminis]MBR0576033.1 nucleotidyl transferase AbiEii/AbiGii toxin family protein [Proteiniclasticum sediminis]
MVLINTKNIILEKDVFLRSEIEKRMAEFGFNSLSKFELFIWDLEIFLQLQKKLGDNIILKGGAATQFYVPMASQRTSVDIDMICQADRDEVHQIIAEIEDEFDGVEDYFKFRYYVPKNPKLGLNALETYYQTVPSICSEKELYASKGKQEVKIEFNFSKDQYDINKIKEPKLFALETTKEFNILAFETLFADKLTTLGPNTIGISDERSDEQVKQIYDVITLFISNVEQVLNHKEQIRKIYERLAKVECQIHNIAYDEQILFEDMKGLINRVKNIESDRPLLQRAKDFQALYLRKSVNRDKTEWAIVGYQLDLLADFIFSDDMKITQFREFEQLIGRLKFELIQGAERQRLIREARSVLEANFKSTKGLSQDLFRKRIDRILWELAVVVDIPQILHVLGETSMDDLNFKRV